MASSELQLQPEGVWLGGWLIGKLAAPVVSGGHARGSPALTVAQRARLDQALYEARTALEAKLDGPWCDAAVALVSKEWGACLRGMRRPNNNEEAMFRMLARAVNIHESTAGGAPAGEAAADGTGSGGGHSPSLPHAHEMASAVRRLVALHTLDTLVRSGTLPEPTTAPPTLLGGSPASPTPPEEETPLLKAEEMKEGMELEQLDRWEALPCRVAFERGKERAVYLVEAKVRVGDGLGETAVLLLAEAAPTKLGAGIVWAIAAVGGADPSVDTAHPKWLHVRVRPSVNTLLSSLGANAATQKKKLGDGRWTLAFADADACKQASAFVLQKQRDLKSRSAQLLEPLLLLQRTANNTAAEE